MNFIYLSIFLISGLGGLIAGESDVPPDNVTVSNNIWIGNQAGRSYKLQVTAPQNATYYDVMKIAAQNDKHFAFKAIETQYGHYITAINNVEEVPDLKYHWMIYILPEEPNPSNKPGDEFLSDVGVDSIKIKEGSIYLFWFKHVKY